MIQTTTIPLDRLIPNEINPKRHSPENVQRLVGRIRAVGFTSPVLVDEATGVLVAGHRRRLALQWIRENLGTEPDGIEPGWLVPARRGDWSELQRLQVLIGDNEDPQEIEFDDRLLTELLADLNRQDALDGAGYTPARLDELIAGLAAPEPPRFEPGTEDDQGKLDEKNPVRCPECGHEFHPPR